MREMKDSGEKLLEQIPASWGLVHLKYLCDIQTGNQDTQDANPDGEYDFYVRSPIVERSDTYTFEGDGILMAGDGAGAGRVFHHAFGKYAVHQRVYRISNYRDVQSGYLFYYLSNIFPSVMDMGSAQSTVPSVRLPMLQSLNVCLPSLNEQHRISTFLDSKCSEIDALTADIQSQIDTIEQYKRSIITEAVTKGLDKQAHVKDSGVFYMAPMNENWYLTKIGYICSKLARSFEPEDTALICSNKGKVLIRPEDASGIMVSEDNAMQGIHEGDIAIHGMDTWHGAIALSDYDGKITRVVHVCDSTEDKRFIVYYLQYLAFQGVYKLISNGVRENTSDFRSWDKVRDIWIAIPKSKSEQKEICDYLDDMCAEIEGTVAIKNDQLATLYAYKKSIIYEYVTGKKEVPAV